MPARAGSGAPWWRPDARQLGQRRGPLGDAELAAHPLEHCPGGEDAAVDRVLGHAVDAPGHGRQQAA